MEAAHLPWRPLGELFVARGLINESELERALAEQAATNKRLGEILVDRGLVSGPDLTSVLMEQLGVEISKEEGFGSGLWAEIKRRHPRGSRDLDEAGEDVDGEPDSDVESQKSLALLPGGMEVDELATDQVSDLGELEGELEELASEYVPPPPIEAFTEPAPANAPAVEEPDPVPGSEVPGPSAFDEVENPWVEVAGSDDEIGEPAAVDIVPAPAETFEAPEAAGEFAAGPVEVEPRADDPPDGYVSASAPAGIEQVPFWTEVAPVAAEAGSTAPEHDDLAEAQAELEAARTEVAHLHEMLADAMTALSAFHAEARADVRPTPRDLDSV